jgi:hypothetical protein
MALWEPPPQVRILKAAQIGYHVMIVIQEGSPRCKRRFEPPNNERHFVSLIAARRYAHSMIQEILSGSEENILTEFSVSIWLVERDGTEILCDTIILCSERCLSFAGKPAVKI